MTRVGGQLLSRSFDVDLVRAALPSTQHLDGGITDSPLGGSCGHPDAEAVPRIGLVINSSRKRASLDVSPYNFEGTAF